MPPLHATPYPPVQETSLTFIHTFHGQWNEFHVTIRNLAFHPHAGSIQTLVKSMEWYAQNFTQIFNNCCTQSQRGPLFDPTTAVIIQDTMSRIYGQLKGLCLLHAIALERFKNLQPPNNSDLGHQGPPSHLNNSGISHQVSPPPNSSSSGISQQESAPFFSNDIETYPQVSASPDQNSSEISHQVSAQIQIRNQQMREGNLMNPMSLMNPSRKYLCMIFLVYHMNQTKMEKLKLRFPSKVSWYAITGVPKK